jgi:hypothetical protein
LIPAARFDVGADPIPDFSESLAVELRQDVRFGELDEAVERDPAEQPRVGVLLRSFTRLPDALIGFRPILADVVAELPEHPLRRAVDVRSAAAHSSDGVDDLAAHVELKLRRRGVPDSNGPRRGVTLEVLENLFSRREPAEDVVKDAKLRTGEPRRVHEPRGKSPGFIGIAEVEQDSCRERSIPQPAVAVVPVEIAADALGKRRRRRGNDGTRRRVRHELQREQASNDLPSIRADVRAPCRPFSPPLHGSVDTLLHVRAERRKHRGTGPVAGERKGAPLALAQMHDANGRTALTDGELDVAPQRMESVAVLEANAQRACGPQHRVSASVIRSRLEHDFDFDVARQAFDHPKDLVFRDHHPSFFRLRVDRHQVGHLDAPGRSV